MNFIRQSLAPGLYLVAVPIGTARDITLRALDSLASADVLAAEDTRSLRKLMDIHGVPLEGRRIKALHDHSGSGAIASLVESAREGKSVAYASEAGMPLIADPGFELVRAFQDADLAVTVVPGPSAVPTALALGGLPTDAFFFGGFLPATSSKRCKALEELAWIRGTLVLFESPKRIAATLADAAKMLGGGRKAVICRELTKKFEETRRGTLDALASDPDVQKLRGEIVLLIDRGEEQVASQEDIGNLLDEALKTMSVKDAAAHVAGITGQKKRLVYTLALDRKV